MTVKDFKELLVWQKAMDLASFVYEVTEKFPQKEIYSITNQMRRSAVSIPSNIAEGQQRNHTKEFIQFLGIAKGSLAELETQLIIAFRRVYLSSIEFEKVSSMIEELRKMLNGLIRSLENSP